MNTITTMDEAVAKAVDFPGAQLAAERVRQGLSQDYVAGKLHLRVRLIELLEMDDYQSMPEPVFIKGYVRGYAKLLGVSAQPLLDIYNNNAGNMAMERKGEKALWQSRRETNKAEHAIRWLTGSFAVIVLIAVVAWWYTNKDNENLFPKSISRANNASTKSETEIRLTDLSKMRSLLSSHSQPENPTEKEGD